MATILPTTPGSIIGWYEQIGSDDPFYNIVTLIPGHIDETTGEIHDAVWASSYLEDMEDEGNVFSLDYLAAQDVEILAEGIPAEKNPNLVDSVKLNGFQIPGVVLRYYDEGAGCPMTYTYAPGFRDQDDPEAKVLDCMFVNSYGAFVAPSDIEKISSIEVLFVPSRTLPERRI